MCWIALPLWNVQDAEKRKLLIQPNASLTKIGLAAPISTAVGVVLNIGFFLYLNKKLQNKPEQ